MKRIIIPIAGRDFDPSEVAIMWKILSEQDHRIVFSTPDGKPGHPDPIMLSGEGLDPWGFLPGLKKIRLLGLMLRANKNARRAFEALSQSPAFLNPIPYSALRAEDYDGLYLPGGHAKGVCEYLENKQLQNLVVEFFEANANTKAIAAICHGVLIAARAVSHKTGKSVLFGRKTTALTWKMEKTAWYLTRFYGRFWDSDYYRTYIESKSEAEGYWSVEAEVRRALAHNSDFMDVDKNTIDAFKKRSGWFRDSMSNASPAFVVKDGNYFSARWPGDIHTLAKAFSEYLLAIQSTTTGS